MGVVSIKYFCQHIKHLRQSAVALHTFDLEWAEIGRNGGDYCITHMVVSELQPYLIANYGNFGFGMLKLRLDVGIDGKHIHNSDLTEQNLIDHKGWVKVLLQQNS